MSIDFRGINTIAPVKSFVIRRSKKTNNNKKPHTHTKPNSLYYIQFK